MNKGQLNKCAYLISHLTNPAMVALLVFGVVVRGDNNTLWVGLLGVLLFGLLPVLAVWLLYKRGMIADIYLADRQERGSMLLWGALWYAGGSAVLYWVSASNVALVVGGTFFCATLLVWGINYFWKISIHSTGVSGGIILMLAIGGREWWPLFLCLPLVAWARLWLQAHTASQIIGGIVLGMGIVLLLLSVVGVRNG